MHISYTQLRREGLSNRAIETYVIARDAMRSCSAEDVAAFLRVSHNDYPVDVEDVWPAGVPEHRTCAHDLWFEGRVPFCVDCGTLRTAVAA